MNRLDVIDSEQCGKGTHKPNGSTGPEEGRVVADGAGNVRRGGGVGRAIHSRGDGEAAAKVVMCRTEVAGISTTSWPVQ